MDTRVRRRVRPAKSCVGSDGFLWAADGDCARGHGGRRVLRPVPAAFCEGRAYGSAATPVDRGRAVTVVADGCRADAAEQLSPVRHRVSDRWAARSVPLLEGTSGGYYFLPDGRSVGRAGPRNRCVPWRQADSRGPVPGAAVVDI